MTKVQKDLKNPGFGEDIEHSGFSHIASENVK